jgi:hypothetical protein
VEIAPCLRWTISTSVVAVCNKALTISNPM